MSNDFSSRLREALIKADMSASDLSRNSGVGKSDISNYLNNKYLPKQDKVYLLAKALNVNPGWLMTGVEQIVREPRPIVIPDTITFRRIAEEMSPDDYEMVMEVFERTYKKMKEEGKV